MAVCADRAAAARARRLLLVQGGTTELMKTSAKLNAHTGNHTSGTHVEKASRGATATAPRLPRCGARIVCQNAEAQRIDLVRTVHAAHHER